MVQAFVETERLENAPASASQSVDRVTSAFARMKQAHGSDPYPRYEVRREQLERLLAAIVERQDEIADAISTDFGNRSVFETKIAEIFTSVSSIRYILRNLKKWMRPERRSVGAQMFPGSARVLRQPLGVVGIISPWNYPFGLAMSPAAAALAAGNRVLLKPSELTPATSASITRLVADVLDRNLVDVVTGGTEVGEAVAALPLDHLFFTGSTRVGKLVARAAAEHLTPVTLELGGKSPTIVHESYPLDRAAARIAAGKWFNAGQTCIAPDYVLVSEHRLEALIDELTNQVTRYYPSLAENPDYTSIVNDAHYARLKSLVEDAAAKGASIREINPGSEALDERTRKMAPTIVTGIHDDMMLMQDEIFGPILPVIPYHRLDEAVAYVNARPRPLALYVFDTDDNRAADVLKRTVSGGACVNETLMHFAVDDAPFGGVGASGMGAYHGKEGFDTFSHKKGVYYQAKWNTAGLLAPPFGKRLERLLSALIGR